LYQYLIFFRSVCEVCTHIRFTDFYIGARAQARAQARAFAASAAAAEAAAAWAQPVKDEVMEDAPPLPVEREVDGMVGFFARMGF
jgi:hypothetical protein